MNIKEIKEVLTLMQENNLTELEIEKEGLRIRIKKASTSFEVNTSAPGDTVRFPIQPQSAQPTAETAVVAAKDTIEIKAPMIGTFYKSPSPESAPYIEVGQTINPGQVICIIEAMKLMNEIKSEHKGKIIEICVENAEPIEYGQIIIRLERVA